MSTESRAETAPEFGTFGGLPTIRVQGGGVYYRISISRSLGVVVAGGMGVVFFLAQAVSVALSVVGSTEASVDAVPGLAGRFVEVATTCMARFGGCPPRRRWETRAGELPRALFVWSAGGGRDR